MQRQAAGVLLNDFTACNAYALGLERARSLACPALFVLGERDAMTPLRAAREMIGAITHTTVVRSPGAGHNSMGENPDEVRDALHAWLRSDAMRPIAPKPAPAA
jgi:pimeloyl-ACP methyl ester carboxylesterase